MYILTFMFIFPFMLKSIVISISIFIFIFISSFIFLFVFIFVLAFIFGFTVVFIFAFICVLIFVFILVSIFGFIFLFIYVFIVVTVFVFILVFVLLCIFFMFVFILIFVLKFKLVLQAIFNGCIAGLHERHVKDVVVLDFFLCKSFWTKRRITPYRRDLSIRYKCTSCSLANYFQSKRRDCRQNLLGLYNSHVFSLYNCIRLLHQGINEGQSRYTHSFFEHTSNVGMVNTSVLYAALVKHVIRSYWSCIGPISVILLPAAGIPNLLKHTSYAIFRYFEQQLVENLYPAECLSSVLETIYL